MFCKPFIKYTLLLSLSLIIGCFHEEPRPALSYYPTTSYATPKPIPSVGNPWIPPKLVERKWTAIIIHHSATANGNMSIFDQWHKDRNWDGVGYDFVIGNGTESTDGKIEVTFRWKEQRTGAHTGGTPGNWANITGIGICLVGDFNKKPPTARQMESVTKLVDFLKKRYGIPNTKIYGHGSVPGGHATDCPGKNFPMYKLKK